MEEVQGGLNIAAFLLLVKCYDNKMVKLPYNCDIYPLTQPQVANQKKIILLAPISLVLQKLSVTSIHHKIIRLMKLPNLYQHDV